MSITNSFCRICFSTDDTLSCIFDKLDGGSEEASHHKQLHFKIMYTLGIRVTREDTLSILICPRCTNLIKSFYTFKKNSLKTQVKLKTLESLSSNKVIEINLIDNDSDNDVNDNQLIESAIPSLSNGQQNDALATLESMSKSVEVPMNANLAQPLESNSCNVSRSDQQPTIEIASLSDQQPTIVIAQSKSEISLNNGTELNITNKQTLVSSGVEVSQSMDKCVNLKLLNPTLKASALKISSTTSPIKKNKKTDNFSPSPNSVVKRSLNKSGAVCKPSIGKDKTSAVNYREPVTIAADITDNENVLLPANINSLESNSNPSLQSPTKVINSIIKSVPNSTNILKTLLISPFTNDATRIIKSNIIKDGAGSKDNKLTYGQEYSNALRNKLIKPLTINVEKLNINYPDVKSINIGDLDKYRCTDKSDKNLKNVSLSSYFGSYMRKSLDATSNSHVAPLQTEAVTSHETDKRSDNNFDAWYKLGDLNAVTSKSAATKVTPPIAMKRKIIRSDKFTIIPKRVKTFNVPHKDTIPATENIKDINMAPVGFYTQQKTLTHVHNSDTTVPNNMMQNVSREAVYSIEVSDAPVGQDPIPATKNIKDINMAPLEFYTQQNTLTPMRNSDTTVQNNMTQNNISRENVYSTEVSVAPAGFYVEHETLSSSANVVEVINTQDPVCVPADATHPILKVNNTDSNALAVTKVSKSTKIPKHPDKMMLIKHPTKKQPYNKIKQVVKGKGLFGTEDNYFKNNSMVIEHINTMDVSKIGKDSKLSFLKTSCHIIDEEECEPTKMPPKEMLVEESLREEYCKEAFAHFLDYQNMLKLSKLRSSQNHFDDLACDVKEEDMEIVHSENRTDTTDTIANMIESPKTISLPPALSKGTKLNTGSPLVNGLNVEVPLSSHIDNAISLRLPPPLLYVRGQYIAPCVVGRKYPQINKNGNVNMEPKDKTEPQPSDMTTKLAVETNRKANAEIVAPISSRIRVKPLNMLLKATASLEPTNLTCEEIISKPQWNNIQSN